MRKRDSLVKATAIIANLLCLVFIACAQANPDTPESVASRYMAAMQAGEWSKCASLIHPEALGQVKRAFTQLVDTDKSGQAAKQLFGMTNAEFSQLSEVAVFERVMQFLMKQEGVGTAMAGASTKIIGNVNESPDLVHVVYRVEMKVNDIPVNGVDIISLRRNGNTWNALLNSDMEAFIAAITSRASANKTTK